MRGQAGWALDSGRWTKTASVVAVAALLVAACSGGSSSSSTQGVTATSIKLGSHQPLTGPAAPGYSEIAPAAKALFEYVNSRGGVEGRKIDFTYDDDGYSPQTTASVVRKLVLQDKVFAILNGLGTPTHQQVLGFLNTEKVPDLFVASGCTCWNQPKKYPYTTGYQPNYEIEGRILGKYVNDNLAGQKVGYLLQNDDFGQAGSTGLSKQIPAADVAAKQNYDVSTLTSGLGTQLSALQGAGAKVVAVFAIPAALSLALLAAAQIGYHPTWVVSSIDADVTTLAGLLQSFSKGKAGAGLLEGIVTAGYLPTVSDQGNPWIQSFKRIHDKYDAANPFDSNTVYGMAVAYNTVQLLQKAGKKLTRKTLLDALNSANLAGPGLLPLTFSASDHRGYEGERMAKFQTGSITAFGPVFKATEDGPITTSDQPQPAPPTGF